MTYQDIVVRKVETADFETLISLIQALADYENLPGPDAGARERLRAHGWPSDGQPPYFEAWIAERAEASGARALGYAITFTTYSTFLARPTLYLEDLFVREECRGQGVGGALFSHLEAEAARRGCGRIDWVVLDWNQTAQEFYHRRGGRHLREWWCYRLELTD